MRGGRQSIDDFDAYAWGRQGLTSDAFQGAWVWHRGFLRRLPVLSSITVLCCSLQLAAVSDIPPCGFYREPLFA